jgi:hypothetical protein
LAFPLLGSPKIQFFDSSGSPLASGTLAVLDPADDTNKASYPTYDDAEAATNANVNPIVLDARGEPPTGLWGLDGEDYKLTLKDSAGATVWTSDDVFLPVQVNAVTSAETAAGVTPTDLSYPPGDVRRYGAVLDGVTNDSAAWVSADSVSNNGGPPIFVPKSSSGMAISSGVSASVNTDIHFEEGAFLLYTGAIEESALTLGVVTANTAWRTYTRLDVRRSSQSDWTNEDNIGIRCLNLIACKVDIIQVDGFTIGVQCEGNDYGYAYNKHFLGTVSDNKVGLLVTNADTSLTAGYSNENIFYGGRFTVFSGVNDTLDRWGVRLDSERASKSLPNANRFEYPSFELSATVASGTARAILINYGLENKFVHCRDEDNDAPFMECENASEWNVAETNTSATSAVQNDGSFDNNFVYPTRQHPYQKQNPSWHSPVLPRVANEYDGAGAVYIPGCSIRNSSNGNQSIAADGITVDDDYLDIAITRGVGVMVDVENIKRFIFRRDVVSGRGGRICIIPYDTNASQLTTDGGYVRGTGAESISHTSNQGGSYLTDSDADNDVFFSVTSDVHFMWVGYFGGTASARVRSFSLESVDGGALSVFQGYLDSNSDPFPNDYQNYATAAPATAAAGPNYPAGKRLTKFNAAAGASPGWICTTQGLGGTAVFKAEASVAA